LLYISKSYHGYRCGHREEISAIRNRLLSESLAEAGKAPPRDERWLDYDMSMKRALVKETPADCQGRYNSEKPLIVPKPALGVSQTVAGRVFAGQDWGIVWWRDF